IPASRSRRLTHRQANSLDQRDEGSLFDADHSATGVPFPRRSTLQAKGIQPCIPGRRSRNEPVRYDKRRYRRRSRIEIMFGRLKDWRRIATRYDRCPTAFFSAVALAATVIFWL
uniref:transposase n=1 Tax=uncultured Sphingomonas sp. TaxID=158754 RepID=UPI0025E2EA3F